MRLRGGWRLPATVRVAWRAEAGDPAWRRLERQLTTLDSDVRRDARRTDPASAAEVRLEIDEGGDAESSSESSSEPSSESYSLRIGEDGVRITAPDGAGLAHGVSTLTQWLRVASHVQGKDRVVAGVDIHDRPTFRHRGVLLDVSRNRIPKMAELESRVELLASLKFNQLQLYFEHAFAYEGHETVWRGYDPLTPDEIRRLSAYCAERHVELVPNQNSFGHLHRWLVHEPYRRLAECPEGVEHPFSPDPEPFSLCPTDAGSVELLRDLYDQLLPCFPSASTSTSTTGRFFNVGLDETLDLGLGRSKDECERLGKHRVYLDFLRRVHGLASERGRRMQFWGDLVMEAPERIAELPRDAVALAWGYEADHDFDRACAALAGSGLDFWVCPGTSSWNSLTGRSRNLLGNVANAAASAQRFGADGLLLCDWGDHGHLQPPSVSLPGFVAGADRAWNHASERTLDELAALLDHHVLGGTPDEGLGALGETLVQLGDVHRLTGAESLNGSALFFQLLYARRPHAQRRAEGMTSEGLEAARQRLAELRPGDGTPMRRELSWSVDLLDLAADLAQVRLRVGVDVPLADLPAGERLRLRQGFEGVFGRLEGLWLESSREGGLAQTLGRWRRALDLDSSVEASG